MKGLKNVTSEAHPQKLSPLGNVYVLLLLIGVNIVNYADRTLLAVLTQPMKAELHLTDLQIGAISGVAFAAMFSVSGLIMARWADRFSRKWVLSGAITFWSAMCLMTAFAGSFWQLFLIRLGLGIGESAAAPTAYALIFTAFAARTRSSAYGLFLAGATIGIGLGVSVGGWLGETAGWRQAMATMAIPGFLVAALMAATMRDPVRDDKRKDRDDAPSMRETFAMIGRNPVLVALIGAQSLTGIAYAGFAQWAPAFYMRMHGMTLTDLGASYAISSSLGALVGLIAGGGLVGRVQARSERGGLHLCMWLNICAGIASAGAFLVPDRMLSLTLFALFGAFTGSTYAPTVATFQHHAPVAAQSMAAAIMMLFVINLGHGGGPLVMGALSDRLSATATPNALGTSLLLGSAALILSGIFYVMAARALHSRRAAHAIATATSSY